MTAPAPSWRALQYLRRICAADARSMPAPLLSTIPAQGKTRSSLQPREQHKPAIHHHNHRRHFATSAPHPGQSATAVASTPSSASDQETERQSQSNPVTLPDITSYYTLFPSSVPHGPPPTGPFHIHTPDLRREFLRLQSLHHPDKYTSSPVAQQKARALSALINAAYKTLSDPLLRAQYLLAHRYNVDIATEDNSTHQIDQETLIEVMDVQESIEEAETHEQIDLLKEDNRRRIQETEEKMAKAFENDDVETAKNECVRLKFWQSLQQGLDEWEPGKEVRLIH